MKCKKFLLLLTFSLLLIGCSKPTLHKKRIVKKPTANLQIARSMEELDRQSKQATAMMLYSYPKQKDYNLINLDKLKYKMVNYVNSIRTMTQHCNAPSLPVGWNKELSKAASMHAKDMSINDFIGHLGSGTKYDIARKAPGMGSNFYERIIFAGYPIQPGELAGEIVTYTKYKIVGSKDIYENFVHAVQNFLKSPKHCALLTNPRFRDVGIAGYKTANKIYWVLEFGEVNY